MTVTAYISRLARITLFIAALIAFVIAIVPSAPGPDSLNDKVNHALAFFVLAALAHAGWPKAGPLRVFLVLTVFGALIEGAQYVMALGREAEVLDLVADMVGTAAGLIVAHLVLRFAPELVAEVEGS
ncbi:VanZ family protein [Alteriqipengyuania lutimaris]|uniref:Teicoplanin resistance protein VanZ n=1 Tax=Alteriqipengyuania lutimaris TaxID=1538146 RepID=A0A395LHH6_9SPHN|nr:VanZ family protein [Alteriqipengyuania lutimaris]MBB3035535.1 VanZ family protein [Alteriqipengyuania lutimaris]RDS76091.1 teicoplanin resistance protein VanZ [Alteriqipengyuania lutimaris]